MLRNSMIGMVVFGVTAALAGYVWTTFEFPFAILLPAVVGWYAVTLPDFGRRKALATGLVGGVAFTAAFIVALFFALTDGSPLPIAGWLGAVLSAALAGAIVGAMLGRVQGAAVMAGVSAAGMLVATLVLGVMRATAPAAVDVEGLAQAAYFTAAIGIVGALVGLAVGGGTAWIAGHRGEHGATSAGRQAPAV